MPMEERPDERQAHSIVVAMTGLRFKHADTHGGVDYTIEDGRAVLEINRFTDQAQTEGVRVWRDKSVIDAPGLQWSWSVTTEGHPHYGKATQLLPGALAELERYRIADIWFSWQEWWLRHVPGLEPAIDVLADLQVEHARRMPVYGEGSRIFFSPMGGYVSDGPNGAVEEAERFVGKLDDVRRKLGRGAEQRHLFLWTDESTPGRVTAPIAVPTEERLPTRAPALPEEVTDLWIVHEPSRTGWWWSASRGWLLVDGVGLDTPH